MIDWPHQTQGVADVARAIEQGHRRICLTSPTGGGKSRMVQHMVEWAQPTVIYANRKILIEQLSAGFSAAGISHGIMAAGYAEESGHRVQIASIQTVEGRWSRGKLNLHPAELVFVDECFPAGTLIDGIPIEDIRVGDSVTCYDHTSDRVCLRPVRRVFRKVSGQVCTVALASGIRLTCTPEHPVWSATRQKYVAAISLQTGEALNGINHIEGTEGADVRRMRSKLSVYPTNQRKRQEILLQQGVCFDLNETVSVGQSDLASCTIEEDENTESHVGRINPQEGLEDFAGYRAQAEGTRRERHRSDETGNGNVDGDGMALQCRGLHQTTEARLSALLLNRRSECGAKDRPRNRRWFTRDTCQTANGPEKTGILGVDRVVGVEVHQRSGGQEFERLCPGGVVFNLEVEEHHNYFANGLLVHNCHNEKGKRMREVIEAHVKQGAVIVGITATPIGIGGIYETLLQAGVTSELRKCGALVAAHTYAPDEPSIKSFKTQTKGILQLKDEVKEVMLPVIFGRVIEHYRKLNPDLLPTLLFAPGVAESLWFAERLQEHGIPAAHIDGEKIWIAGETMASDRASRQRLREASESGEVKVVCNRFVLREGVDWPHLAHGIFACTFGGICSYLQAGGRLLRNHPDLDTVTIQDHGGNYWRHDSLNADREWNLEDSEQRIADDKAELFRTKAEPEPIVCPQCSKVRANGVACSACGFTCKGKVRMVVETNGKLRQVRGDIYKPRRVSNDPADHKKWTACVYRCKNSGRTFNQARALFQMENYGKVPGLDFPLLPTTKSDWYRKVRDVPFGKLGRKQEEAMS